MIASVKGLSYRYPSAREPTLSDVTFDVAEGSFTLVAGPSAGGKSTLLRVFNGLVPQFHGGALAGSALIAGHDPSRTPARRMATLAGMVFQEPESQAVTDVVEDEIVTGMEQHSIGPLEMSRRLEALLPMLGIERLRHRQLSTLSGGERQRVAIAAVLALEPPILLLDEPTSQLDPAGAAAVITAIERLHGCGLTVFVAEHRLERLLPRCEHVLEVDQGRVTPFTPREAAGALRAVPSVCELGRRLGLDPLPLTVEEARPAIDGARLRLASRPFMPAPGDALVRTEGLTVAYGENVALRDATLTLREGEVVALLGPNGSGKTTLFRALAGLVPAARGKVAFAGHEAPGSIQARTAYAGLVPQDPAIALYHETVREEVAETARNRRVPEPRLEDWSVEELADRNPRDLSVGQQQRVAIAAMLAHLPRVWLLDEPTRGADADAKRWLAQRLRDHAAQGGAAIVATHDIESAARWATRVVALEGGAVIHDLPARSAFGDSGPFPTQVARLVPGALLPEEVAR